MWCRRCGTARCPGPAAGRRWSSGGRSGSGRASRLCSARWWRSRRRSSAATGKSRLRAARPRMRPWARWRNGWRTGRAGGAVEEVAGRAVLDPRFVKGMRERLLARAFMIRAIVLMTLMPDAGLREAVLALAGDLAMVPWARPRRAAPERALGDWRNALGPGPLEELQSVVLKASR